MIAGLVPGIGNFLGLLHMAMLYALYSFEYKWIYQGKPCHTQKVDWFSLHVLYLGWIIHQRVNFVEKNWPYFLGFGLPLAILTSISNSLVIR